MPDRHVRIFLLLSGLYFVSKDVTAVVLYTRNSNKTVEKRPQYNDE